MGVSHQLVEMTRQMNRLDTASVILLDRVKKCKQMLMDAMEVGAFPTNARIDGATVYHSSQVWASPLDGDHDALTHVLSELGLYEYVPHTVNSQSLSAYVREHLDEDETKDLEERLATLDPRLRSALKITDKQQIKVTGA